MSRTARTVLTVAVLGVLAVVAYLSVAGSDDDEPAAGPPPTVRPADAGTALRAITVDDSLVLRWETETDRGPQPDLTLVMAEGLEIRREGPQVHYRLGDVSVFCFDTGAAALTCELDPTPSELVPSAGNTRFAATIAEPRVIAGRDASCWSYTADSTTTESCVDDETEVLLFSETVDTADDSLFRQTLVEWSVASTTDVALPSEVEALVG